LLVERLHAQTGLSKSNLVKRALGLLAGEVAATAPEGGLFALGQSSFGRHGQAERQSSEVKRVVRERLKGKAPGRALERLSSQPAQ
jgi:hypothetical protein